MISLFNNSENETNKIENKTKQLHSLIAQQNKNIESFFEEHAIDPEEIANYLSKEENFTKEEWAEIQKENKVFEENLQRDMANIPNPIEFKKHITEMRNLGRCSIKI